MSVGDDHLAFALRTNRALPGTPRRTYAWSPYSLASALGVLGHRPAGDLADAGLLAKHDDPCLAVANRLWIRDGLRVHDDYARTADTWPGARVHKAPFATEPDAARGAVNEDIACVTRGLIPEVLPRGSVDRETAAVLVSALWLKVAWADPFPHFTTHDATFHGEHGAGQVPMMHRTAGLRLAAADGWRMARLATREPDVAVDLLLPHEPLAEAHLAPQTLAQLRHAAQPERVWLTMPRFRLTATFNLRRLLFEYGLLTVDGVVDGDPLTISHALHRCVLRVDEDGVEGAAAGSTAMRPAAFQTLRNVIIDRPFLMMVTHVPTGAIYFMARVGDLS
jgi:serpin B